MIDSLTYWIVLILAIGVFWLLPRRFRLGFLGLVSWAYLATVAPGSVLALSLWVGLVFLLAPRLGTRRWLGPSLILGILGFLAWFKYVPALKTGLAGESAGGGVAILLGISYYSFKLVHYVVEVGRGHIAAHSFPQFFSYMFLVPIFTAGPIERFDHYLAHQEERLSAAAAAEGLTRVIHGLIKKFVIAEMLLLPRLGELSSSEVVAERLPVLATYEVWGFLILTYLVMYMDFSAYSDIAIGSSRLFGLRIMENFDWPLVARNIVEFWRRWHMTLRGWCQSYVYMPTLGLTRNPYVAIYATFLVMGLWHSATANRLAWGVYHGTGVAIHATWSRIKRKRRWRWPDRAPWRWAGWPLTFLFVSASFTFSASELLPLRQALRILAKLVFIDVA